MLLAGRMGPRDVQRAARVGVDPLAVLQVEVPHAVVPVALAIDLVGHRLFEHSPAWVVFEFRRRPTGHRPRLIEHAPARPAFSFGIHQRHEKTGETSYVYTITAYGDMSAALVPTMVTQIYIGDDVAYLEADWLGKPGAWYLTLKQAGQ